MEKIDLKKVLNHLYGPTAKKVTAIDVPKMNFLMIDGQGDPGTAKAFSEAIEALYPLAYTLKFMVKRGGIGIDYGVMPLFFHFRTFRNGISQGLIRIHRR